MRTDGRTDMTKLIVVFRNFAKAPKNHYTLYEKFLGFHEIWKSIFRPLGSHDLAPTRYRGADKSLARPGRKQATANQTLTFTSHSKRTQKAVRPTRSPRQQSRTKNGDLSIVFTCICLIAGCLSGEKSHDSVTRTDVTA